MEPFGAVLYRIRIAHKHNLTQLAVKINQSPSAISRWELGNRQPKDVASVVCILLVLSATPAERKALLEAYWQRELPDYYFTTTLNDLLQTYDAVVQEISNLQAQLEQKYTELNDLIALITAHR